MAPLDELRWPLEKPLELEPCDHRLLACVEAALLTCALVRVV